MMSGAVGENGAIPRVAHRHMYLWIEDQIEAKERGAKGITTITTLEHFYQEVKQANEGNKHYNFQKLQELVAKAPPYSLLYNKALNLSTNVLKRWNRSNGMINWFLRKIGRGPPTADEVIQVARVHLARSVIKRGDYAAPLLLSGVGAQLGKRPRSAEEEGGVDGQGPAGQPAPTFGPPPIRATDAENLFEVLKARFEGKVAREPVLEAVQKDVWHQEGGSYTLNNKCIEAWSEANAAWQAFSEFCQESQIKHDQFLFDFGPEKPVSREHKERERQREKQKEKQRQKAAAGYGGSSNGQHPSAAGSHPHLSSSSSYGHSMGHGVAASSSTSSLDRAYGNNNGRAPVVPFVGGAAASYPNGDSHGPAAGNGNLHPFARYGGGNSDSLGPPPSQRARYGPSSSLGGGGWGGAGGGRGSPSVLSDTGGAAMQAAIQTLYDLFDEFQRKLVRRVLTCQAAGLDVELLGVRLHEWDEAEIKDWATRTFIGTDLFMLFPYFMRLDSMDDGHDGPSAAMLGHPVSGRVQQLGVYTFRYADDRYLVICAYLVAAGREARFFGKYLLSSKAKCLSPYGCGPVCLGVASNPVQYMHEDDVKSYKLWCLAEAASFNQPGPIPRPKDLIETLKSSLPGGGRGPASSSYLGAGSSSSLDTAPMTLRGGGGDPYAVELRDAATSAPSTSSAAAFLRDGPTGGVPALRDAAVVVGGGRLGTPSAEVHRI